MTQTTVKVGQYSAPLKLWELYCGNRASYDEYDEIIVLAPDESQARLIAFRHVLVQSPNDGPRYAHEYLDASLSTVTPVDMTVPGVVLAHYHAG